MANSAGLTRESSVEVQRLLHGDERQAALAQIAGNLKGQLDTAEELYGMKSDKAWMYEWVDNMIGVGGKEDGPKKPRVGAGGDTQYDISIFGPPLRGTTTEALAAEIFQLLLAKDSDFTDAMINIDQDNFLASPYEAMLRNAVLNRKLLANLYAAGRELYLSMPLEDAMQRMHYYREHIRGLRSVLYLLSSSSEQLELLANKIQQLEDLKDKYEATIFTLRRQLMDYHSQENTVGRSIDGTFGAVPKDSKALAHANHHQRPGHPQPSHVSPTAASQAAGNSVFLISVQVEDLISYRTRHRAMCEQSIKVARDCIVGLGQSYELKRTNYLEEKEDPPPGKQPVVPTCFMFTCTEGFNALAYAAELHSELNNSKEWPKPLMDMTKFSEEPWRGLRIRVGVHHGVPSIMDGVELSRVTHFEGIPVEKAMRLTGLGIAGDTIVSSTAWEHYQQEMKEGRIPPAKRYSCLRGLVTDQLGCGGKRGFKKGETVWRLWHPALMLRQTKAMECDFAEVSFWKLEATGKEVEDDDEGPTAEDLLAAKDTEMTLLQQELDRLQLQVIKRETDMEELQTKMLFAVEKLQKTSTVKQVYLMNLVESLECATMESHDLLTKDEWAGDAIRDAERKKQRLMEGITFVDGGGDDDSPGKRPGGGRHRNQKLWRELKGMVSTSTGKPKGAGPQKRTMGARRDSGGMAVSAGNMLMFKLHSTVRIFSTLIRRFTIEGSEEDCDNQALTEDQFIQLFMKKVQSDTSLLGSAREALLLMASSAIEDPDVEESNEGDPARLMRSCGGHLSKIFRYVSSLKKRAMNLMAMTTQLQEVRAMEESGDKGGAAGGAGGKGKKGDAAKKKQSTVDPLIPQQATPSSTLSAPAGSGFGAGGKNLSKTPKVGGKANLKPPESPQDFKLDSAADTKSASSAAGKPLLASNVVLDKVVTEENFRLTREVDRLKAELEKMKKAMSEKEKDSLPTPAHSTGKRHSISGSLDRHSLPSSGAPTSPRAARRGSTSLGMDGDLRGPSSTSSGSVQGTLSRQASAQGGRLTRTLSNNPRSSAGRNRATTFAEDSHHSATGAPAVVPSDDSHSDVDQRSGRSTRPEADGAIAPTGDSSDVAAGSLSARDPSIEPDLNETKAFASSAAWLQDTEVVGAAPTGPTADTHSRQPESAAHDSLSAFVFSGAEGQTDSPPSSSTAGQPPQQGLSVGIPVQSPRSPRGGSGPNTFPAKSPRHNRSPEHLHIPGQNTGSIQVHSLEPPTPLQQTPAEPTVAEGFSGMDSREKQLKEKWAKERAERNAVHEEKVRQVREEKERLERERKAEKQARMDAAAGKKQLPRLACVVYDDTDVNSEAQMIKNALVVENQLHHRPLSRQGKTGLATGGTTVSALPPPAHTLPARPNTPGQPTGLTADPLTFVGNTFQVQTQKAAKEQQLQMEKLQQQLSQLRQLQAMHAQLESAKKTKDLPALKSQGGSGRPLSSIGYASSIMVTPLAQGRSSSPVRGASGAQTQLSQTAPLPSPLQLMGGRPPSAERPVGPSVTSLSSKGPKHLSNPHVS